MKLYAITIISALFALIESFALPRIHSTRATRLLHPHDALPVNNLLDEAVVSTISATSELRQSVPTLTANNNDPTSRTALLIPILGMLTGLSGVLCYRRFNCFLHMMTGCTFRAATSFVEGSWSAVALDVGIILSFITGTACFRLMETKRAATTFPLPLTVALSSSIAFCLSDILYCQSSVFSRLVCPLLALGFGILNAFSTTVLGVVTSAATGHYTKIGLGCAETVLLRKNNNSQTSQAYLKGFISSVLLVSVLYRQVTTRWTGLIVPPPLGLTLAVCYTTVFAWYSYGFRKINIRWKSILNKSYDNVTE
jgi:uncharacterized membrane protein YoaK (UPF0700 family)